MAKSSVSVELQIGDQKFTSKGATLHEALTKLEKPAKIMTKAMLTVTKGKLQHMQQFMPVRAKRLFFNPTFQAIIAKQLEAVMKPVKNV